MTAAVFRARQSGLATFAGTFDGTNGNGPIGGSVYTGQTTTARGVEAEVSGRVTDRWMLGGGITHLRLRDATGADARLFLPRDTLKLTATYQIPQWHDLKLGANLRYQSAVRGNDDSNGLPIRQGSYATLDLLAGFKIAEHVEASINVRNVKYLNSFEWGQAFYAAQRDRHIEIQLLIRAAAPPVTRSSISLKSGPIDRILCQRAIVDASKRTGSNQELCLRSGMTGVGAQVPDRG